jgi:hypothetical protein
MFILSTVEKNEHSNDVRILKNGSATLPGFRDALIYIPQFTLWANMYNTCGVADMSWIMGSTKFE